ncbi:folate-binding protein [Erythrobacter sp. SCSIO 43205]|uniref:CAF17-like 4Fe-4S cluster assembly/insertion protein YgfZ n=1 Tax=Erythrobacter sp. SCSIO 43205 TaxID=2779361 RepID=UPI001CA81E7A|nr:folate-binding protein [Erythrobacter sp. SCSIO 43205]UAB79520.1 folate-binding protein [Erythrobacter sp. SCSIO 43205]
MNATQLKSRSIIRLRAEESSEDVRGFLQRLVTNDVSGELPVYAALLSAQGKAMFDFFVWAEGEDILIDCEATVADDLLKRLSLYRLRRKIAIERDENRFVHWSPGAIDGATPDPRLAELGYRWIDDAPGEPADDAYLAHRLSLGVPEGQSELGDILWLETNAVELSGVSFEKGCYIGQENTARMNWRQKVNRRLVVVPLDQSQEKRCKADYPELGYAVDHLRVADLDPATLPDWQAAGITA